MNSKKSLKKQTGNQINNSGEKKFSEEPGKSEQPDRFERSAVDLNCKPDCYGDIKTVFPMGETNLRETPHYCRYKCLHKTDCLKNALLTSKGRGVEEELLKRGTKAGTIGFFERWSRKKQLNRLRSK